MMKNFIFVGLIALLYACNHSSHSTGYTVTGVVNDSSSNGKKIYILRYDDNRYIDSTVIENNQFTFRGHVDTTSYCRIVVDRGVYTNFILENGDILVDLHKRNQPSGTLLNDKVAQLTLAEDSINDLINRRVQEIKEQYGNDEQAFDNQMKELVNMLHESVASKCSALYEGHWDDAFGYALLYSQFFDFTPQEQQKILLEKFGNWLKSTQRVQRISMKIEAKEKTAEGMPYIDIAGTDAEGKPIALSDFVGKGNYVLMDMWASWCGPCIGEIPNLARLHNKYKDKGLTVIGVFVSDKQENLKRAINSEGVTWPQIFDKENKSTLQYGVDGIPHIILFSPDGTILKRNLRGDVMIKTVEEIMDRK